MLIRVFILLFLTSEIRYTDPQRPELVPPCANVFLISSCHSLAQGASLTTLSTPRMFLDSSIVMDAAEGSIPHHHEKFLRKPFSLATQDASTQVPVLRKFGWVDAVLISV